MEEEKKGVVLYKVKDLERIFGVAHGQAYALANSQGFPSVRIGRRFYIEETALKEWLKNYEGKTFLT